MKVNKRKAESLIVLTFIISSIIITPILISLNSSNIFFNQNQNLNQNHDNLEDFLEKDPPPISTSSNSPPNASYFNFYKKITINSDKVSDDLVDFPLLVSILDTELHNNVIVQADGDDIAFSNGTIWLDHEIELFNQNYNSKDAKLVAWVKIPLLLTSVDTIIYMYYGNSTMTSQQKPTGVWDSNFAGVWHLNETTGGTNAIKDSTANSNDGTTDDNSPILGENGQISKATGFNDASNQRIEIADDPTLQITDELTVEAWIKPNDFADWETIVSKMGGSLGSGNTAEEDLYFATDYDGDLFVGLANSLESYEWYSTVRITTGIWQHVILTYNSSSSYVELYYNGESMQSQYFGLGTLETNTNPFYIGFNRGWLNEVFRGTIDEVRISNVIRSAGWIATEFNNQYDPKSFYSVSGRFELNPPKPEDFNYYKIITIDSDKVSGSNDLIDFPLLISILDSDLHDDVQSDGDDIAFYNGTTWLDYEIELFDQNYNPTHAKLTAWIRIPRLSISSDTVIFMYYGNSTMESRQNPTGVWDRSYVGVWHLNEDPTGIIFDSTSNNNDGESSGMNSLDLVNGKIGEGLDFDGSNDYIQTTSGELRNATDYTIEAWFNADITSMSHIIWQGESRGNGGGIEDETHIGTGDCTDGGSNEISIFLDGHYETDIDIAIPFSDTSNFNHLVGVFSDVDTAPNGELFLNGVSRGMDSGNDIRRSNWDTDLRIGRPGLSQRYFNGIVDEARVSIIARSDEWIATEYSNQYQPDSFYSVSDRFEVHPSIPEDFRYYKEITIDHLLVSGTNHLVNFSVLLSTLDEDLHDDVQPDGDDIAFFKDGQWLDHEIELFNQSHSSTHAQLISWIRLPYIYCTKNTTLFMFYSNSTMSSQQNPAGVWDRNYKGVWHLNEDPSGTPPQIKDRTVLNSDGSSYGFMTSTDQVSGKIDGSLDFDGNNDYLDFGNPSELQITGAITVEVWFKADFIGNDYLITKGGWEGQRCWEISFDAGGAAYGYIMFRYSPNGFSTEIVGYEYVELGRWYHVVGVFKPSEYASFYVNGTEVDLDTTGISPIQYDSSLPVRVARRSDNDLNFFDGIVDELRISDIARSSDWIATEYNNQYDPDSFHYIGVEQFAKEVIGLDVQINALDLYGNLIPNVNVSMIKDAVLIKNGLTEADGSILFTNISLNWYNFSASIESDFGSIVEIVNQTSEAILIDKTFQTVNLTCDVGSNFFKVIDIEGDPVDSGYILVGTTSEVLRSCAIDENGNSRFWWVNTTPYEYNFTVKYFDTNYNPNEIILASGDISAPNSPNTPIIINTNLTTVNFTILGGADKKVVSGAKLLLIRFDNFDSIVNLTTNQYGIATMKWVNSSGLSLGKVINYSLQIDFFGLIEFNYTVAPYLYTFMYNFTVIAKTAYTFIIKLNPDDYQTELVSLNPNDYTELEWGRKLKIRALFTVTKPAQFEGPIYADSMSYDITLVGNIVQSGTMSIEEGYLGKHFAIIDTSELKSDNFYLIVVSAQKSGFTLPSDLILQLRVLKNDMILNQSVNGEVQDEVYWLENANMSVQPYGKTSEELILEDSIYKEVISGDHSFELWIPDLHIEWNLTKIVLNVEGITFGVEEDDINITIKSEDYGTEYFFNKSNASYEYYGKNAANGTWNNLVIDLNSKSLSNNNTFNFNISGTFIGSIDIIVDTEFTRDKIYTEYYESNITDSIILPSDGNGWAIKNVIFELLNCQNLTGDLVNPANYIDNITTFEGHTTKQFYDIRNGYCKININDTIINPLNNQFLFYIGNTSEVIFDVIIKIEYIQEFYQSQYLESFNLSKRISDFNTVADTIQISPNEVVWIDKGPILKLSGINNGFQYFLPSELAMNITLNGQKFSVSDTVGGGEFLLTNILGFTKNTKYAASIETNQPVNFSISFKAFYLRTVFYETKGSVVYNLTLDVSGIVQYVEELEHYQQIIDTSLLNAGEYTTRFSVTKEHYGTATLDLNLKVQERLTLISGSSINIEGYPIIYVQDTTNFTFIYTDALNPSNVTSLDTQSYTVSKIDSGSQVSSGNLVFNANNEYILDINSETLQVGRYSIWITLEKQNYQSKQAHIVLTVNERTIEYDLGDMFEKKQTSVVKGETITLSIELSDPTKRDIPLTGAKVTLEIDDDEFEFEEVEDGVYELEFKTDEYEAFFTSMTLTGTIKISKANYTSEDVDITIVIEIEELEVIPEVLSIPIFYLLLAIAAFGSVVGSLSTYKYIQIAKIPKFVKKARVMKKAIKAGNKVPDSLLTTSKEESILKQFENEWEEVGISLGEILRIKPKKDEVISNGEGGAK